jgi:hypothetical protein
MELYVHTKESEEPRIVEVDESVRLEEVVSEHGEEGSGAWLEEVDEELDIRLTVKELEIGDRSHIHINRCRRIDVIVRQDTEKSKAFGPSATVAKVYEWATGPDGFDLLPAERVKHTFVICGTQTEPDKSAHVGSFADAACAVCFNLVPKQRSEG